MACLTKMPVTPFKQLKPYFLGAAAFALYYISANRLFGHISPTMILLGLPCPACGLTRAGLLLFSGQFAESFRMHPLFVPALFFILWLAVYKVLWPENLYNNRYLQNISISLLIVFFAVYIIRMAHMFPHEPPMVINRDSILHNIIFLLRGEYST